MPVNANLYWHLFAEEQDTTNRAETQLGFQAEPSGSLLVLLSIMTKRAPTR